MRTKTEGLEVQLSDEHAGIYFEINGYRPNEHCCFGEIDNSDILQGLFKYALYDSGEWGAGELSIRKESIHKIVRQLHYFIDSTETAVHIDEQFVIDISKRQGGFELAFSMNDQLAGDYITVHKHLSNSDLSQALVEPFDSISNEFP